MCPETSFSPAPFERVEHAPSESSGGYADGYAAGWAAGSRAAARAAAEDQRRQVTAEAVNARATAAALQSALTALARVTDAFRVAVAPVLAGAQSLLARAAIELAETILSQELTDGETAARAALRRATAVPEDAEIVRIRLHPDDLAVLRSGLDDLTVPEGLDLVADGRLARGDAIADLGEGIIDARISTALTRAREGLEITE